MKLCHVLSICLINLMHPEHHFSTTFCYTFIYWKQNPSHPQFIHYCFLYLVTGAEVQLLETCRPWFLWNSCQQGHHLLTHWLTKEKGTMTSCFPIMHWDPCPKSSLSSWQPSLFASPCFPRTLFAAHFTCCYYEFVLFPFSVVILQDWNINVSLPPDSIVLLLLYTTRVSTSSIPLNICPLRTL